MLPHKKPRGHKLVAGQMISLESWWRNQDQFVLHEGLGANAAVPRWSFDEADSQLVLEKQLHDLVTVARSDRQLNMQNLIKDSSDKPLEQVLRNCGRCS